MYLFYYVFIIYLQILYELISVRVLKIVVGMNFYYFFLIIILYYLFDILYLVFILLCLIVYLQSISKVFI